MQQKRLPYTFWVLFFGLCFVVADNGIKRINNPTASPLFPVDVKNSGGYFAPNLKNDNIAVPTASYNFYDSPYNVGTVSQYDDNTGSSNGGVSSIFPIMKYLLTVVFRVASRLGVVVTGAFFILLIGGLFTVAVCTYTPLCTITFMGYGMNKGTVRSILTPSNVQAATSLVKETLNSLQNISDKNNTIFNE